MLYVAMLVVVDHVLLSTIDEPALCLLHLSVFPAQLLSELCEMSLPFSLVLTVIRDELARSIYSDFFVSQDGSLAFDQVRPPKHPSDEPLLAGMPRPLANRWAQAQQRKMHLLTWASRR
jgi:hypothetical protein